MDHAHSHGWTVAGSAGSFGTGLFATAANVPGGPVWTLLGILASIATPVLVQWVRSRHDERIRRLEAENARLFDQLSQALADHPK